MMMKSRKLLLSTALVAIVGMTTFAAPSKAADVDVDASFVASVAITINKTQDIDFGAVDFVAGGNEGNIVLGPDGNRALTADTGLTLTGSGSAGEIDVTSSTGTIDVSCDATGVVDDGSRTLNISEVKFAFAANAYGDAGNTTCAGLAGTPGSIDTGSNNDPTIYIGATLAVGTNALDGSLGGTPYSTTNPSGDPIAFRVVYQ